MSLTDFTEDPLTFKANGVLRLFILLNEIRPAHGQTLHCISSSLKWNNTFVVLNALECAVLLQACIPCLFWLIFSQRSHYPLMKCIKCNACVYVSR